MSKTQRLLNILFYINRQRKVTAGELSAEFGTSVRTVQRDLAELEEWGVPLYSEPGPGGGYTVLKNNILPPSFFTEDEGIALYFSYQHLLLLHALPFQSEIKAASDKLYASFPAAVKEKIDQLKERVAFWAPPSKADVPFINELLDAAVQQIEIRIAYESRNGQSNRVIVPYGIYSSGGLWYCPAYDRKSGGDRLFRADRILSVEKLAPARNGSLTLNQWMEKEETRKQAPLKVRLSKNGVRECKTLPFLSDHLTVNEDGTGIIDTFAPLEEVPFMAKQFILLGEDVYVEEPAELIGEMVERAQNLLRIYRTDG